jgi:carbamoylphosphate synthase small subunit
MDAVKEGLLVTADGEVFLGASVGVERLTTGEAVHVTPAAPR